MKNLKLNKKKGCSKHQNNMKTQNLISSIVTLSLLLCLSCKSKIEQNVESEIAAEEYVIPFIFKHDRIYLEGVFKDSTYYFMLDNGAMVTCLSQSLFQHNDTVGLRVPDTLAFPKYTISTHIKFRNYDFALNEIAIAPADAITSKMFDIERYVVGLIGVKLFADKIVELNFEDSLMVIRNTLPENINEYQSFDMLNLENCVHWFDSLYKQIELSGFYDYAGNSCKGRLTLDLGTHFVTFTKTIKGKTDFELSKKDTTTLVAFILNNNFIANIEISDDFEQRFGNGILGVVFFSKFHTVFDYPNNKLYLKRNNLPADDRLTHPSYYIPN